MGNFLRALAALILSVQIIVFCVATPATAISADLANKCRDMAIKAYPPPSPRGNKPYAQAERDFFRECVSRNGQKPDADAPKDPTNSK
jgi:hypothetical protein